VLHNARSNVHALDRLRVTTSGRSLQSAVAACSGRATLLYNGCLVQSAATRTEPDRSTKSPEWSPPLSAAASVAQSRNAVRYVCEQTLEHGHAGLCVPQHALTPTRRRHSSLRCSASTRTQATHTVARQTVRCMCYRACVWLCCAAVWANFTLPQRALLRIALHCIALRCVALRCIAA
jgi:hypothetical protein